MKTLTELCTAKIVSNFSIFKNNLQILPKELQENINEAWFNDNYQIIAGRVFLRKQVNIVTNTDWGNYQL